MANPAFFSGSVTVPNNAASGSLHNLDVPLPEHPLGDDDAYVTLHNPGAVAITVRLFNRETLSGTERFDEIVNFVVNAGASEGRRVTDWPAGEGSGRFQVSPNALVGAAGVFTVPVEVRRA